MTDATRLTAERLAVEVERARDAIRRIHHYGYPPDGRLAADVESDVDDILSPLLAEIHALTTENERLDGVNEAMQRELDNAFDELADAESQLRVTDEMVERAARAIVGWRMDNAAAALAWTSMSTKTRENAFEITRAALSAALTTLGETR